MVRDVAMRSLMSVRRLPVQEWHAELGGLRSQLAGPQQGGITSAPHVMISSCLLGHDVTYKGGQPKPKGKTNLSSPMRNGELFRALARAELLTLTPICPEVDLLRLSIPRNPVKMVAGDINAAGGCGDVQLLDAATGLPIPEWERRLRGANDEAALSALAREKYGTDACTSAYPVCGFIGRSRSPSCGVGSGRVYPQSGDIATYLSGSGVYAAHLERRATASVDTAGKEPPVVMVNHRGISQRLPSEGSGTVHVESLDDFLGRCWDRHLWLLKTAPQNTER